MPLPPRPPRAHRLLVPALLAGLVLAGCGPRAAGPAVPATAPFRERLAALALRQVAFGSVSLIPVRFEHSRVSKPFVDEGRTLYCVSARMKGRTFGRAERPKIVVREAADVLTVVDEDTEICEGHRTEPFPELDTPVAPKP